MNFSDILDFVVSWWGLLALVVIFFLKLIFDYSATTIRIRELIFLAEEHARKQVLNTSAEKFEWVKINGYKYLPPVLKIFLSEYLFALLIQEIFDKLTEWAADKKLLA